MKDLNSQTNYLRPRALQLLGRGFAGFVSGAVLGFGGCFLKNDADGFGQLLKTEATWLSPRETHYLFNFPFTTQLLHFGNSFQVLTLDSARKCPLSVLDYRDTALLMHQSIKLIISTANCPPLIKVFTHL